MSPRMTLPSRRVATYARRNRGTSAGPAGRPAPGARATLASRRARSPGKPVTRFLRSCGASAPASDRPRRDPPDPGRCRPRPSPWRLLSRGELGAIRARAFSSLRLRAAAAARAAPREARRRRSPRPALAAARSRPSAPHRRPRCVPPGGEPRQGSRPLTDAGMDDRFSAARSPGCPNTRAPGPCGRAVPRGRPRRGSGQRSPAAPAAGLDHLARHLVRIDHGNSARREQPSTVLLPDPMFPVNPQIRTPGVYTRRPHEAPHPAAPHRSSRARVRPGRAPTSCRACHAEAYRSGRRDPTPARGVVALTPEQQQKPLCLQCHSRDEQRAGQAVVEGVSCETCHGGGRYYQPAVVMRDKELSRLFGLARSHRRRA